jgi:hypothetical protein
VLVSFAVVLVTIYGCSGSPSSNNSTGGPGNLSPGTQALRNLTPFEKKILKDKHVTLAGLLESTQVYEECLTRANIQWTQAPGGLGPSSLQTIVMVPQNVSNPDAYNNQMQAKTLQCLNQVSAVEDVWVLQNQASQGDIQKAERNFVSCLRKAGLSLPPNATFEQAGTALQNLVVSNSGGEIDPNSALGQEQTAATSCGQAVSDSAVVALPGLADALKSLDTSSW